MNDPAQLLSLFLEGALGRSGRKRARKAARFVRGNKGLVTASGLLAAAGVAWGIYDSLKTSATGATGAVGPLGTAAVPGAGSIGGLVGGGAMAPPPPVPGSTGTATAAAPSAMPDEVRRIVRLAISAARADGDLSAPERAMILDHARRAGVEAEAEIELAGPHPLSEIVRGVTEQQARDDLYTLAFAIVRADETVTGGERIYLAQLAHQLGLDPTTVARLESEASSRIDAADEP